MKLFSTIIHVICKINLTNALFHSLKVYFFKGSPMPGRIPAVPGSNSITDCVFIFFHREGFFQLQDVQGMLERNGSTILCCEYSYGRFCQVPSSLFPNLSCFTSKDVTPACRKTGEKTI